MNNLTYGNMIMPTPEQLEELIQKKQELAEAASHLSNHEGLKTEPPPQGANIPKQADPLLQQRNEVASRINQIESSLLRHKQQHAEGFRQTATSIAASMIVRHPDMDPRMALEKAYALCDADTTMFAHHVAEIRENAVIDQSVFDELESLGKKLAHIDGMIEEKIRDSAHKQAADNNNN